MRSPDHLSPQLRMFIPAGELANTDLYDSYDRLTAGAPSAAWWDDEEEDHDAVLAGKTAEETKAIKLEQARTGSVENSRIPAAPGEMTFRQSVEQNGPQRPVHLFVPDPDDPITPPGKVLLGDGQHMLYTLADIDPTQEVPVIWH